MKSEILMEAYRNLRNQVNRENDKLKWQYFAKKISDNEKDIKGTWNTINKLVNRRSKTTEIPYLEVKGEIISESKQKVEALNDYFATIGRDLNSMFQEDTGSEQTPPEGDISSNPTRFRFRKISENAVLKAISRLKSKKSFGLDGISSYILKIAGSVVSKGLANIFNISISTGTFPDSWKIANVAPIFKEGSKSEIGNYRPISILSTVARVFERLVYDQLSSYMEKNKYLSKYQSGFRKFHSTVTSMLRNSNDWLLNMDRGNYNGVVFFDIKKAFDTVDHEILLCKLNKYGISGVELSWFKSYLSDRKQSCFLNGESSSFKFVECGIPQGSCLGPLLFIIYINDLPNTLKNITPSIFADDTGISVSSDSVPDIQRLLREDISAIQRWMHENKLTLNALKTEFILIASKPRLKEIEETCCIEVQGETIYRAPYVKSLGFYIDQNLDWDVHVDHVIKKASAGLAILRRTADYFPMEVLKTIYRSLVESHFRYGNIIWGTCGEVLLTKLQKMQNRAARIITKSDYDTEAGPLIDKLGWKTIRELNNNDAAVMMFKIMNNMAPPYLTGMFQPLRELHEIILRDTNSNLRLPLMSSNMGQRSFSYHGADIWNKIKPNNKTGTSLQSFKRSLSHSRCGLHT